MKRFEQLLLEYITPLRQWKARDEEAGIYLPSEVAEMLEILENILKEFRLAKRRRKRKHESS